MKQYSAVNDISFILECRLSDKSYVRSNEWSFRPSNLLFITAIGPHPPSHVKTCDLSKCSTVSIYSIGVYVHG